MKIKYLENKNIIILGLGLNGFETAQALKKYKEKIIIIDKKFHPEYEKKLLNEGYNLKLESEVLREDNFKKLKIDLIIKSPGVPFDHQILKKVAPTQITNDIELAYLYIQENNQETKIIAVTGTNGKTSTVLLLESALQIAGFSAQAAGNVGISPLTLLQIFSKLDYLILELSSFQLKHIQKFHPDSAFITNVTPDHLNMHNGFNDYLESKQKIYQNLDYHNHLYVKNKFFMKYLQEKEFPFEIHMNNVPEAIKELITDERLGSLNFNNVVLCYQFFITEGIDPKYLFEGLDHRPNLEHRMEFIAKIKNVKYYNDSKATNLEATKEALKKLDNIILIVGGKSKGQGVKDFSKYLANVKAVIAYGENAKEFDSEKVYNIVDTLDEALEIVENIAKPNDNVLLSPASASFDQYLNYQQRGDAFKKLVRELEQR